MSAALVSRRAIYEVGKWNYVDPFFAACIAAPARINGSLCAIRDCFPVAQPTYQRRRQICPQNGPSAGSHKSTAQCTGHSSDMAEVLYCRRLRPLLAPPPPSFARRRSTALPSGLRPWSRAQAPMIATTAIGQSFASARVTGSCPGIAGYPVASHSRFPFLSLDLLAPHDAGVRTGL